MTLYLDTSALVKLFLDEMNSSSMHDMVETGSQLATSRLTYVEAHSAFARRRRERDFSIKKEQELIELLNTAWPTLTPLDVTQTLIESAAVFVRKHGLRAYDALQLASAVALQQKLRRPVTFAAFDAKLNRAAKKEHLLTLA